MEEFTKEEIKSKWLNLNNNKGRSFHLYVDSPFCVRACKYCIYTPIITKVGSAEYNDYYKRLLIDEIDYFKDVMEKYNFETIYFGGGTSSLMTKEVMVEIFERIPNFREIPFKLFEAHPSFLTDDKIELLEEYGFTNASIGVQSFDKELIASQNRIYNSPEKIKHVVDKLKSCNIMVNCDLLTFMRQSPKEDLECVKEDLEIMTEVNPTFIDLYVMHNENIYEYPVEDIYELRKIIAKFYMKHPEWRPMSEFSLNKEDIEKLTISNYHITSLTDEELRGIKFYNSSGANMRPADQNVLALGCSEARDTYSYFGHDLYYVNYIKDNEIHYRKEVWDRWDV